MTTAGLLDNTLPLSGLRTQRQPSRPTRSAFAQHLQDADAGIPAAKEEGKIGPHGRMSAPPREEHNEGNRESGVRFETIPVAIPTMTDAPLPLELHFAQGDPEGAEFPASSGSGAPAPALADTDLPELQPDSQQTVVELLPGDLAFAAKVGSEASIDVASTTGKQQPSTSPPADRQPPLVDQRSSLPSDKDPEGGAKVGDSGIRFVEAATKDSGTAAKDADAGTKDAETGAGRERVKDGPLPPSGQTTAVPLHAALDSTAPPAIAPAKPASAAVEISSPGSSQVVQLNPIDHQPQKAVTPLRDIQVQVGGGPQERVDVRLVDRSGELHVAVRSGSDELTHDLRQGLTELVGKLETNGYRTEVWRPGTVSAAPVSAEVSQSSDRHDRESQAYQGWNQNDSKRERQDQQKPRWVEDLESSVSSGARKSSGGFHGFIR